MLACCLTACDDGPPVGPECPSLLKGWSEPQNGRSAFRTMNTITLTESGAKWNGQSISDDELRQYLSIGKTMDPVPFTVFDPSGAPNCREAAKLRDKINDAADCQVGGDCGQGSVAVWKTAPGLRGPGWIE